MAIALDGTPQGGLPDLSRGLGLAFYGKISRYHIHTITIDRLLRFD
jgi:hypothetical protein